jgi:hypothetical protein
MIFEDEIEEVMSTVTIWVSNDMIKDMRDFTIGNMIMVKCHMVFNSKNQLLSLTAEKMQAIGEVKVIITWQVSHSIHHLLMIADCQSLFG